MNAIVIEHVKVSELPEAWQEQLGAAEHSQVTVRIEQEPEQRQPAQEQGDDPLFGMWADRDDMADVQAYVRKLRASRF